MLKKGHIKLNKFRQLSKLSLTITHKQKKGKNYCLNKK